MANVTYLLGAGASAGKYKDNDSNKYKIEGLPCVNEISKSLNFILGILRSNITEEIDLILPEVSLNCKEDWIKAKDELLNIFNKLSDVCKRHATIDTYAKKLRLQCDIEGFKELEQHLTLFFIFEQIIREPDSRYETFLANILESNNLLPNNIKVLSWNYDTQIELAFYEYNNEYKLNIGSKTNENYQEYDIIKINGTSSFKNQEDLIKRTKEVRYKLRKISDMFTAGVKKKDRILLEEFIYLYKKYVYNKKDNTNLSFAFDDNKVSDEIIRRSNDIIRDTNALVIIGYTFPFFNREIDRKVLSRLSPKAKVYIQDLAPEKIKESFKAVLPNFNDNNISLIRDVTQFYLPPEL